MFVDGTTDNTDGTDRGGFELLHLQSVLSVLSVVNRLLIGSMYPTNHSKDQSRKWVFCGIRGWSLSICSFAWSVRVYSSLMMFVDGTTDDTDGTDRDD